MGLILQSPNRQPALQGAYLAQVSYSGSGGFGALGGAERRGIPIVAPRGMSYLPCEGDRVLLLPVDGGVVCLGVLSYPAGTAGESHWVSSGGAAIHLLNSGDAQINGLTVDLQGNTNKLT